jgi:DNA-binding transcriptional LysR family regulator
MTAKIDLLTLQLFVAIVEEQSIAKAAERKNIAASAVSRRISDIEELFQVELLHRHSKGIEPTPAGYALLEHARIILGNLAQLETELSGYQQGKRGHIRICANKSAILESLAGELSAFLEQHPLVRIDLEENISPAIVQAVVENRADIGIFGGNIAGQELELLPYRSDRLVVLVTGSHPLAARKSVSFRDLIDHDFVSLEKGSSIESLCMKAAAGLGKHLKLRIRVSGFDALFRLVDAGMGLGVVPQEIIRDRYGLEKFVAIALDESWAQRELVMGVRDYKSLPPVTRMLVDHLRRAADEAAGQEKRQLKRTMSGRLTMVSDRA